MIGSNDVYPRPLSQREAEVLDFLLSVDDARVEQLRDQRTDAVVSGICGCGCATIHLAVDRTRSHPAKLCGQPISASPKPTAELGEPNPNCGLLVFLDDGWLNTLEICWIEKPPPEFPPVSSLEAPELTCERDEAALAAFVRSSTIEAPPGHPGGRLRALAHRVGRLGGRPPTT